MAQEALFVYGTLCEAQVQQRLFKRTFSVLMDKLSGYRVNRITLDGVDYPIAIPDAGSQIMGQILTLSQAELVEADEYESDAYQRLQVILVSGQSAWVYCSSAHT
jgi:gamma-glutamylcyclotransferase (GGCT)/AIG2-like uncharacterized protein YtfP